MQKIYIAGPLFTPGERELLEKIDHICQNLAYETYLPHRDAGLFTRENDSTKAFFDNDLLRLDEADLVIAVLNGIEVDSGTSWEMGYAYACGKPIIGYVNDTRIYEPFVQLNLMITNSIEHLITELEELQNIISRGL